MNCSTCGCQMKQLSYHFNKGLNTYWCPRCGTVNTESIVKVPRLVSQVIPFCKEARESTSTG